jgi:Rieske Fe-S protein
MSVNGGTSRRTVLLATGTVGAAGVLTACAGEEPGGPRQPAAQTTGAANPPGSTTSPGATSDVDVAADGIPVAQIPVGSGHIDFDRVVVVTQPEAGQFRAFDANCTHEHCIVTFVDGDLITCPCHGSQFRISDGSVARGPATQALPSRTATRNGDVIVVS